MRSMRDFEPSGSDFGPAPQQVAEKVHRDLGLECGFAYDFARSVLLWMELSFYPQGTWLCRLQLEPQQIKTRRRRRTLTTPTDYYFLYRPTHQDFPIMPLGNDTDWILRANKHYGLRLGKPLAEDQIDPTEIEIDEPAVLHRIIEYLHFYYNFTRYEGYMGGPIRFRVPRKLDDLEFATGSNEERQQVLGALWRFLDAGGTGVVQPAIGTVRRFIRRCHADVPIQIQSSLWRLRVSIRLRSGYVRLYGQVPFFHSPDLVPPPSAEVKVLPPPWRLFRWEPWLLIPERVRAATGALAYFALAVSWMAAVAASMGFAVTFVFHPSLVAPLKAFFAWLIPLGWQSLWLCAAYAILVFGLFAVFVIQFDGVLKRAARTAPSLLRGAYVGLEKFQRVVWDWFRPKLQSPVQKGAMAGLWLLLSSVFLILAFTTLQVAYDPAAYSGDESGQRVLRTFIGHATIAFPGMPYLLGAINLDPLLWLKDPDMRSAMVFGFRIMMLIVVFRAFWKMLGYASPRVLSRDNRRLEHEIAKLRRPRGAVRSTVPMR
jgi:hypothetical protein